MGRRVYNESDYDAAKREFFEETQISISDIRIIGNHKIFTEIYRSYDNVEYKNIYYIAEYIGKNDVNIDPTQKSIHGGKQYYFLRLTLPQIR